VRFNKGINQAFTTNSRRICHTLKYLILGCDYLLQYVHLSIEFSENFKDFSGNYSIYLRARSIYFIIWKALKFFFMSPKYFIANPREYIFRGLKYLSGLF
jgi:hypothetical protein